MISSSMCAASSGPGRRSATRRTGRNTSATSRGTAVATCSSTSIRSGPMPTPTSSPSTTTCRSRTGGMGSSTPMLSKAGPRSTTGPICNPTSPGARVLSGSMPRKPIARRRRARQSAMAAQASLGCSATRISAPGGRSRISTAPVAWRRRRPRHGCRNRNRSGSPSSAVPPWIVAPTSRTCSSKQMPHVAHRRRLHLLRSPWRGSRATQHLSDQVDMRRG